MPFLERADARSETFDKTSTKVDFEAAGEGVAFGFSVLQLAKL